MNRATDEQPEEGRSQRSTGSPGQPDPEILIIGHTPRAPHTTGGDEAWPPGRAPCWLHHPGWQAGPRIQQLLSMLTVVVIVLAGLLAHAINTPAKGGRYPDIDAGQADIQQLRQLTRTENQALMNAHTDQLETLLAPAFSAVTIVGEDWSGRQMIAALGSGEFDVRSFRINEFGPEDPIQVRLHGNLATVTYQADMEIASHPLNLRHDSAGAQFDIKLRTEHTDSWIRADGNWQQIHAQTCPATVRVPPQ